MKPIYFLIVLIPLAAWGMLRDVANIANGGSVDLRNRITGARVAAAKTDPYSYKWQKGHPEEFCDLFNEPAALLSKTTVTPWVLANHAIFNSINYRSTQWYWFFIQYGALGLAVWFWFRLQSSSTVKMWGVVLALMFSITPGWRHHIDHGQIYVTYVFLMMVLWWISQKERSLAVSIGEGALGAFMLGCRPLFLGQFAIPVSKRQWYAVAGASLGILLVYVVPTKLFHSSIWIEYKEAMESHSEIYLNQMKPSRVRMSYPGTIEGIKLDTLAGVSRKIPFADTSIFKAISFNLPATGMLLGWCALMGGSLLFAMWKKRR